MKDDWMHSRRLRIHRRRSSSSKFSSNGSHVRGFWICAACMGACTPSVRNLYMGCEATCSAAFVAGRLVVVVAVVVVVVVVAGTVSASSILRRRLAGGGLNPAPTYFSGNAFQIDLSNLWDDDVVVPTTRPFEYYSISRHTCQTQSTDLCPRSY